MIGRKARTGTILICALALCAFMATSASAATSGTTAVTCVSAAPFNNGDYTDAHCDTTSTPGAGAFKHEAFAGNPTNHVVGTNTATKNNTTESTPSVLSSTVAGIVTVIECTTVGSEGTFTNTLVGEEHRIEGSGIVGRLSGCTVLEPAHCTMHTPGEPAGSGKSNNLKSESVEGTPMTRKISPESGTTMGTLEFENSGGACSINGSKCAITGSISTEPSGQMLAGGEKGASSGATLITNITKASGQLKVGGQNAGVTHVETIKMENGNPIGSTGPPF